VNLPNTLTMLRIVLTFAFIFFLFMGGLFYKLLAFATFLLASLTDLLDGFLAKRNNQITDFGKLMDPIADKILVLSAFIAFVELKIVPAWMVIIIVFREVVITALRGLAYTKGRVIAADGAGKHKTVSQVVAIFMILLYVIFREGGEAVFKFWTSRTEKCFADVIYYLMIVTVILTVVSGVSYLVKNRSLYSSEKKN